MEKIEHIKKAVVIAQELSENGCHVDDVVCIAENLISIALASYGFSEKLVDGAIDAIAKDIKSGIELVDMIKADMKKKENNN